MQCIPSSESAAVKTQLALRLDEDLVELARREAERQNRSLANFIEVLLADSLMATAGEVPVVSLVDADIDGIEAIDDNGMVDDVETARLRDILAISRQL
jgi:hypothetical protein